MCAAVTLQTKQWCLTGGPALNLYVILGDAAHVVQNSDILAGIMANLLLVQNAAFGCTSRRLTNLKFWALNIKNTSSTLSFEFLHQSIVPTMHYQRSLPRLPIPKLEDTIRRYLDVQRFVLDDAQFRITERLALNFLGGVGRQLHEELVTQDRLNRDTSYMAADEVVYPDCDHGSETSPSASWLDAHLSSRGSLWKSNAYMCLNLDQKMEYNDQLVRATNILCSAVRFVKTLRAGLLEPDVLHRNPVKSETERFKKFVRWVPSSLSCYVANMVEAYPLDMSQYNRMFNSTRIPKPGRDELFTDDTGRHVLVMRKGNMYVFDVMDRDGNLVKPTEIQSHLKYILSEAAPVPDFPLGVLTSENRDVWADLRDKLEAAGNAENLRSVDSALFCLCLDDGSFRDLSDLSHNMLNGDGCNRWFDKSLSIIVTKDGQAAINFEHSWGDGIAVLRFLDEVFKDTTEKPLVHPGSSATTAMDSAPAVRQLNFNLDSELKDSIKEAKVKFNLDSCNISIRVLDFPRGGRRWLKKQKMSADAVLQLAFQMAFLTLYNKTVIPFESCSIAMFKHGRLETIPTANVYTKWCSHAFVCQPSRHSTAQLKAMLQDCSNHHRQLIKQATLGQSPFCHLAALKHLATSKGWLLHDLYIHPAIAAIDHHVISSSSLTSPSMLIGGYAPVVPNGFGIAYGHNNDKIRCNVSSNKEPHVEDFAKCIHKSLEDIFQVLEWEPIV